MTFDEDSCRVRKGHAAENLALLRKLTLNLLRHDQTIKDTMRGKRIRAALCEKTLETLMKLDFQNEVARGVREPLSETSPASPPLSEQHSPGEVYRDAGT